MSKPVFIDIQEMPPERARLAPWALGVDFGTSLSWIALTQKDNDGESEGETVVEILGGPVPSSGYYDSSSDQWLAQKRDQSPCDGAVYASSCKRWMDPQNAVKEKWGPVTPFQNAQAIFRQLSQQARIALQAKPGPWTSCVSDASTPLPAVITVPAYFDEARRSLIKRCAEMSGFAPLRLLSEPTAALMSYAHDLGHRHKLKEKTLETYAVYDLGGGTFDVSCIEKECDVFHVKATGGHADLGGDDFDALIAQALNIPEAQGKALRESMQEPVAFRILASRLLPGKSPESVEKDIRNACMALIIKTGEILRQVLTMAHTCPENLDALILVGGCTRWPFIQDFLKESYQEALGVPVLAHDPELAVVKGAALYAHRLSHGSSFLLLDVNPLSLGLEISDGMVERLIARNHALPASAALSVTTGAHGQNAMKIHVVQGEGELVTSCRSLACFDITGIPPGPKGKERLTIEFHLDVNGLLTVSAKNEQGHIMDSQRVNPYQGLEDAMISGYLEKEGQDLAQRLWLQKHNYARDLIAETRRIAPTLSEQEAPRLEECLHALEGAMTSACLDTLSQAVEVFEAHVLPIMERHLGKSLALALHSASTFSEKGAGSIQESYPPDEAMQNLIGQETQRQREHVELIASENFASPQVLAAQGSILTNKYAEGYPGKRYYGGCQHVDHVEILAQERLSRLFNVKHANVQPHSGSQANQAVFLAFLSPGDTIVSMSLTCGGHLTHGSSANLSGRWFNVHHYGLDKETQRIDMNHVEYVVKTQRPKLLIAGASAYSRWIDFQGFQDIARRYGALLMVDMAHISGLVAAGVHPSPVPYADILTSTTHKTLRGPRGGFILCHEDDLAKKIDAAVFPGLQGGPLMHVIAAKGVCFHEALCPAFSAYGQRVLDNVQAMVHHFLQEDLPMIAGGSDNHLLVLDLRTLGISGKQAQERLEAIGITTNKNTIPMDTRSVQETSGLRLGSAAMTTRGFGPTEMTQVAKWIAMTLRASPQAWEELRPHMREQVANLVRPFPLFCP